MSTQTTRTIPLLWRGIPIWIPLSILIGVGYQCGSVVLSSVVEWVIPSVTFTQHDWPTNTWGLWVACVEGPFLETLILLGILGLAKLDPRNRMQLGFVLVCIWVLFTTLHHSPLYPLPAAMIAGLIFVGFTLQWLYFSRISPRVGLLSLVLSHAAANSLGVLLVRSGWGT